MNEYIDKAELLCMINKLFIKRIDGTTANCAYNKALIAVKMKIAECSVFTDVQPVKCGKWSECYTDSHLYSGICSFCGKASIRNAQSESYEFCPHCAADMRGGRR